ncbi:MAG TPA: hypothetical protein VNO33_10035 [Kofleriaceae bacterium]|nr:hypothetical protein [Kofleriaceae bacterium]
MRLTWLLTAFLSTAIACGGDDDGGDDGSAGAIDAAAGSGDAGSRSDAGDGDGLDAGNTSVLCGGLAGLQCEETHYCDWPDDDCGSGDGLGACRPRPTDCKLGESVCGCDGDRYESACAANMAGADVREPSNCEPTIGR